MVEIINKQRLIENGNSPITCRAREIVLKCLEHVINSIDPKELIKTKIKVKNGCLNIEGNEFDLRKFKHIYVLGGGKAGAKMAQAIEEIIGNYITAGIMNIPYGTSQKTSIIEFKETSHPIPDERGVAGTSLIMALAQNAQEDDLIICLLSGGGSSLMPLPRQGVSLNDKQQLTSLMLKSGANISEVNVIRKHLSAFKGGWLAKAAYPATLLNIVLSDVIGDQLESIASGPTVPDPSTFEDAINILKKYNTWNKTPASIQKIFLEGAENLIDETPKPNDRIFEKVHNFVIGNNSTATKNATAFLESLGLKTIILENILTGEAREAGKGISKLVNDYIFFENNHKSMAMIAGGETTVTVKGTGIGGRNQELILAAALDLRVDKGCAIASFSTDGIDGMTNAAGAIIDRYTIERAEKLGLNAYRHLDNNDSSSFFSELRDLIYTGATGTNVNDLVVIVILNYKGL